MATYTSISAIEALLQITLSDAAPPSSGDVTNWIEEVETSMKAQNLSTQTTLSGTMFDVSPQAGYTKDTMSWFFGDRSYAVEGRTVIPPYTPIISVASGTMQRNKAGLVSTPDWDTLKNVEEFPTSSDNDYLIQYNVNKRTNKRVGHSFFFFQNAPSAGRNRLRATWTYGHNVDTAILREYATLKVAEKVIMSRLFTATPMNVATYTAGQNLETYVNTQYVEQLNWIRTRIREIEDIHFPEELPMGIMRG